jgi:hypothetical protein
MPQPAAGEADETLLQAKAVGQGYQHAIGAEWFRIGDLPGPRWNLSGGGQHQGVDHRIEGTEATMITKMTEDRQAPALDQEAGRSRQSTPGARAVDRRQAHNNHRQSTIRKSAEAFFCQ